MPSAIINALTFSLLLTPWPLATMVVAPITGRLIGRYRAGLRGTVRLLGQTTGCADI